MANALEISVEMVIALIIIVGSFMYFYETLLDRGLTDILFAVLVFAAGIVYLFSLVYGKAGK